MSSFTAVQWPQVSHLFSFVLAVPAPLSLQFKHLDKGLRMWKGPWAFGRQEEEKIYATQVLGRGEGGMLSWKSTVIGKSDMSVFIFQWMICCPSTIAHKSWVDIHKEKRNKRLCLAVLKEKNKKIKSSETAKKREKRQDRTINAFLHCKKQWRGHLIRPVACFFYVLKHAYLCFLYMG